MTVWILTFLTFIMRASASTSAEVAFIEKINRARSGAEVRELEREFEELRIARHACRLQLHERHVPAACFEVLARESRWKLVARESLSRERLDALCDEAAGELCGSADPSAPYLSPSCRASLKLARKIRAYRDQDLVQDLN